MRERAARKLKELREIGRETSEYWLVRFLFLRILGLCYIAAYLSLLLQLRPLLGSKGLTPVSSFLARASSSFSGPLDAFWSIPTLFWFNSSDAFLMSAALLGALLSVLLLLGYANAPSLGVNWLIYLSFVNVGQVWYGYGWESQLVETGFLAIFLAPLLDPRPLNGDSPPPRPVFWLLQWLTIRVNIGSGLIKLRGSTCWESLTCLDRFFETQPIPNPVSRWMHFLPSVIHRAATFLTHAVQLLAPLSIIGSWAERSWSERGRRIRIAGGVSMLAFQLALIATGNLSFLNWLTVAATVSFLDDRFLERFVPARVVDKARRARCNSEKLSRGREAASWLLVAAVAVLSVPVVLNLFGGSQMMNASFNQFKVVNTYGAFGSVRPGRTELVVQGLSSEGEWRTYDFRHKPDSVDDPLTFIAPYQPRMAWQMWFASMSAPAREPWLMHWVWKELEGDPAASALTRKDPVEGDPRAVRVLRYDYSYTKPWRKGPTWESSDRELWLPPVNRSTPDFRRYVTSRFPSATP